MEAKDKNTATATGANVGAAIPDEYKLAYPTRRECEIIADVVKNEAARDVPEIMWIFTARHADALKRAWEISPELVVDIISYAYWYVCSAAEMLERYMNAKPQTKDEDAEQWAEVEEAISLNNRIASQGLEFVMVADGLRRMFIHYCQCLCRELGAERWKANFQRQYARLGDGDKIECAAMLDLGGRNLIFHIAELEELSKAFADAEAQGNALEPIAANANIFSCLQGVANLPPDVKSSERLILFVMLSHRNFKTGECFPTVATLAHEANMSKRQVLRHVENLERRGYLQVGKRKTRDGDGNTYKVYLSQRVTPMTPTKNQRVTPMTPTKNQRVTFKTAEGDICDIVEGDTHDTLTENIEQRSFEQRKRMCVCDIGTP